MEQPFRKRLGKRSTVLDSKLDSKITYEDFTLLFWNPNKIATPEEINKLIVKIRKEAIDEVLKKIRLIHSDELEKQIKEDKESIDLTKVTLRIIKEVEKLKELR